MAFNKEKVMDAARKFVDKGQIDKAVKEYLRIVKEDPKDVRVWLKIGDLYAKKGSKGEATESYLKVAEFYQEQGFYLKAVAVYKQILKLDPRLVDINLKLAEIYRQYGLMSDAMQHFESVAAHFHREGKTKEALATVRSLVDLDPENVATRIKLAELYSKEEMVAEAVTEFSQACEQLRKQGRWDDFIKVGERLLWHKPDRLDLARELASLYLARNDARRALQKLQACFKADSRDVETLALLAQSFQALDQKAKTVSVLKELARVFDETKQRERAEDIHRKILLLVPGDPESTAYLGDKKGKTTGARAAIRSEAPPPAAAAAPAAQPGRNRNLFTTNDVVIPTDKRTGALPLVDEKALSGDFSLPDYEQDGDFAADLDSHSRSSASTAGEIHADEISKILTETDVYVKYGLHQKAIDHLRRVFALDAENLEARERLKDVFLSQGRDADAVGELMKLAEQQVAADPERATAYIREVLSIDATHRGALDLARRHRLDFNAPPDVEVIDASDDVELDPDELGTGGVAAVEDDIDFDDIDFGDPSRPLGMARPGGSRADSFDGIDPSMFRTPQPGFAPGSGRDAAKPVRAIGSDLENLRAKPLRPQSIADIHEPAEELQFEDGVVDPGWGVRGPGDTALTDEAAALDREIAAELSGARSAPSDDDELEPDIPFDPYEARAFDANVADLRRSKSADLVGEGELGAGELGAGYDDLPMAAVDSVELSDAAQIHDFALDDAMVAGESRPLEDSGHYEPIGDSAVVAAEDVLPMPASTLEDDLDEADFYVSQGMVSEAEELLRGLLARQPNHPLILAKLAEIGGATSTPSTTGSINDSYTEAEAPSQVSDTRALDLDDDDVEEIDDGVLGGAQPSVTKRPQVMLEKPLEDSDAETHYDLGQAYKEMGLHEEAIKAFEKIVDRPGREVQCRLMIGLCRREQGNFSEAVQQFKTALHAPGITDREKQSLLYEIGVSYEAMADVREALYYFEMVVKRDPKFLDAKDRVARLKAGGGEPRRGLPGSNGNDDDDSMLDGLMSEDT